MNWWIERHTTHDLHLLKNEFNKDSVSYQKKIETVSLIQSNIGKQHTLREILCVYVCVLMGE